MALQNEYFAVINSAQKGPFSGSEIEKMITQKEIDGSTFIWCEGMSDWTEAAKVGELQSLFSKTPGKKIELSPAETSVKNSESADAAKTGLTCDAKKEFIKVKVTKEARAQAKKHADAGQQYFAKNDFKAAAAEYTKATELNPNDNDHFFYLGINLEHMKEYDKAINAYTEASLRNPKDTAAYSCQARIWKTLGNYENAAKNLIAALNIEPNFESLLEELGNVYMAMKNYSSACKVFERKANLAVTKSDKKAIMEKLEEAKRLAGI